MPTCPDTPLHPHGRAAVLGVPLVAGLAALVVLATGANQLLFRSVNAWPATTGDALWRNLTVLGEGSALLALCALMFARRSALVWAVVFTAVLLLPALHGLKDLISLARPVRVLGLDVVHVIGRAIRTDSFPSGHTATAFAGAALMWSVFTSWRARVPVLVTAALTGLSRVAVGAHWPLDVLGGAMLGWLCGCAAVRLASRFAPRAESRWQWIAVVLPLAVFVRILFLPESRSPRTPAHYVLAAVALAAAVHVLLSRQVDTLAGPALAGDEPATDAQSAEEVPGA